MKIGVVVDLIHASEIVLRLSQGWFGSGRDSGGVEGVLQVEDVLLWMMEGRTRTRTRLG